MIPLEKPGTPEELVHHGVKGQKWGVRKQEETEAINKSNSALASLKNTKVKAALIDKSKIVIDRFDSSDNPLSPERKKQIAYTLAGTVAAAAILGGAYYLHKKNLGPSYEQVFAKHDAFNKEYLKSIERNYKTGGIISSESFRRSGFELPVGHQFSRVSRTAEQSFGKITYAHTSDDDFNRYLTHMGPGSFTRVVFKANRPVKVPDLNQTLDALQESLGPGTTREAVHKAYTELSGGNWDHPEALSMFSNLKKKGYSAIVDEAVAGFVGEKPLVIFDHSGLGSKKSKLLSTSDVMKGIINSKDFVRR